MPESLISSNISLSAFKLILYGTLLISVPGSSFKVVSRNHNMRDAVNNSLVDQNSSTFGPRRKSVSGKMQNTSMVSRTGFVPT